MKPRESCMLIVSVLMLTACGGGGGGAPSVVRTSITGTAAVPSAPVSITAYSGRADLLIPINSSGSWPSIMQGADYTFDTAAATAATPSLKVVSMNILPVDTLTGSTTIVTGAANPAGDPALGQMISITNILSLAGMTNSYTAYALTPGLPPVTGPATVGAFYQLPYSATFNPAGYTYQTYGMWATPGATTGSVSVYFFSSGVPTVATPLPVSGTATYNGYTTGIYVNATTRDPAYVDAAMNATANFANNTVTFNTTSTTTLSFNTSALATPTPNPGLDMNGTLNYAAGSNTFTGTVTTANGMSGNATGRFYGPGIAAATATKSVGAPPEIGGTFAVMNSVGGAMQGAFGGK